MRDFYDENRLFDASVEDAVANPPRHIKNVTCCVDNCAYNDGEGYCTASNICIGPGYAKDCTDTVCASFKAGK